MDRHFGGVCVPHDIVNSGAAILAAASLLAPVLVPQVRAQAPASPRHVATGVEACQAQDEATFRVAVEALTVQALGRALAGLDHKGAVSDAWRRGNVDRIVAQEVDIAIEAVRSESSLSRLIESILNPETARALATPVAERVFRSDAVKQAVEQLALDVGREIGQRIEVAAMRAAVPAARCVEAFLGPRYGTTIAKIVSTDALRAFTVDPAVATATVSPGAVLAEGGGAIAGIVIVIVRRELAMLANRIAQRLVGVALGRAVSSVIGGIGVVLIAKDVWDFRHGVMPIIAEEMKSPDTREKVQQELAKVIGEQIGEQVNAIGAEASERVLEIWREFRRAHAKVVELAERDDAFRQMLEAISPARVPRLSEAVALILSSEGEAAIQRRLANGSLQRAVERMPPPAFEIARDLGSIDAGLAWAALAGDLLPRVLEDELHRRSSPTAFTRAGLARLVGLNDRLAAARLAAVDRVPRDVLLELSDAEVRRLARALLATELASLAGYLGALERPAAGLLLDAVSAQPARMQALAPASVRHAVLTSRDPAAALRTMLRGDGLLDLAHVIEDFRLARAGTIAPRLVLARHPVPIAFAAAGAMLLLMLFWRMLFGRRVSPLASGPEGG
jgi:hypothetical protein